MGKNKGKKFEQAQVGEALKISVALTLQKLSLNEKLKELEFPSSLTADERKYVHIISHQLGYKSKSRNKGSMRFLTVYKKEGSTIMSKEALLELTDGSKAMLLSILQRWPVTNKERQDLLPATEKDRLMNPELRDLSIIRSLGRLTPGPPQIPIVAVHNDLTFEARKLPVWSMKDQLLSAVNHNQVIMISGETGSGKTTQVPQIILQEGSTLGRPCRIFCTQPRRISALSIAERVASERGEKVGYTVGYQIRLEGKFSPKTLLTFCTTGVLLRTLMMGESALATITHVIVDEIHERDRFTDFLLIVLRDCLSKFRHLKLILMSANLDVNLYAKYFSNCPVVNIPGKTYPVKEYFLEDILEWTNYRTPKMQNELLELQNKEQSLKKAVEWTSQIKRENSHLTTDDKESNGKKSVSSSSELLAAITEVQKGVDTEINEEMDQCIEKAFISGDEEHFQQMLYLILSENVSPDYKHSLTWAAPLMVASGRGRLDIMEQLFTLGASVNQRAANDWTAADWAQSTGQLEAVQLLQSYSTGEGIDMLMQCKNSSFSASSVSLSEEMRIHLKAYSMSIAEDATDLELIFALVVKIHFDQPPGGILVFLPGYEDIVNLRDQILNEDNKFQQGGKYNVFCLHSNMQSSDQKRVFRTSPSGFRKIVLSTNIAETSVTINDIVYVIDCGKMKEMTFDALSGISCLRPVCISQASALQRSGRAGRCQPGICYHLFSKSSFNLLQPHQTPEILRTPLQDLCLHTKLLAMPNMLIADFLARAPEPPAFIAVKNAVQLLKSMDALDPWEDVTELGHHLLDLPIPPHLGKMVITAAILKCLDPVLTIAACLAHKNPFVLPRLPADKKKAKMARKKLASGTFSDHIVLIKAFQAWQKACSEQRQNSWCANNFISGATMEIILGMRAQVLAQLRSSGFVRLKSPGDIRDVNSNSDNWAVIKAALVAGMYPNLIRVDRDLSQLRTEKESKVRIHSSSVVIDYSDDSVKGGKSLNQTHKSLVQTLPSDWLIFDEMVRLGALAHVRTVTVVSPFEVLLMAGPMRLPLNALSEPPNKAVSGSEDVSSDSESEDRPEGMNCFTILDAWVQFLGSHKTSSLALQLRHKLHALILRRLRAPSKSFSQSDEDIISVIASILSQEEQKLGLLQPVGIGQRPRPFYSNSQNQDYVGSAFGSDDANLMQPGPNTSYPQGSTQTSLYINPPVAGSQNFKIPMQKGPNTKPMSIAPRTISVGNSHSLSAVITVAKTAFSNPNNPALSVCESTSSDGSSSEQTTAASVTTADAASTTTINSSQVATNRNQGSCYYASNGGKRSRFFIIRVASYKQIEISQSRGVWAFPYPTEKKLLNAAQNGPVVIVFALSRGNQFHGYAKFTTRKCDDKGIDFSSFGHSGNAYKIEWVRMWFIHFHQARHLQNPYNDNLQIHMCRDGQEVEPSVGEQLISVWDNVQPMAGNNPILMNDGPTPPLARHPLHSHGPPHLQHPHMAPPFHHGPPHPHGPFQRPFRGHAASYWGAFGGNFRGRGGYRR